MSRQLLAAVFLFLVIVYTGSYVFLTTRGLYAPVSIGMNGHNTYAWAPLHFFHESKWDRSKIAFYLPLYCIDVEFWHTRAKVASGQYPIDIPPKLIRTNPNASPPPFNLPAR
jgi:hypothetical protein